MKINPYSGGMVLRCCHVARRDQSHIIELKGRRWVFEIQKTSQLMGKDLADNKKLT